MTIDWQDPPPAAQPKKKYEWAAVAEALRENPGRWALVLTDSKPSTVTLVTRIRQGSITAFRPAGHYDATSRVVDGGVIRVYARYVAGVSHA